MFCDSLSAMGPPCGPFHLEKRRALAVTHHFMAPTPHSYISVCGANKKLSKMVGSSANYALWSG